MILRHLALRAPPRAALAARQCRRFMASDVDILERTVDNSLKETHSIEAALNSQSDQHVPAYNPDAERQAALTDPAVAEDWHAHLHSRRVTANIGAKVAHYYEPHTLVNNPPRPSDVTLELLLASQAHLGHSTSVWNPANARYIFGIREGIHIIALDQTAAYLRRAAKVVREVARRGGLILFVGTRDGHERAVVKAAQLSKGCHLFDRWIPGSLTNGQQILGKCRMKVVDEMDQERPEFNPQLLDRAVLKPDLVVCLNPLENYVLLHECSLNHIPTIGIIDTNSQPTWVTYPIPANDDSLRCIQVIAGVLGRAGEEGQKLRLQAAAEGDVTFMPAQDLRMPEDFSAEGSPSGSAAARAQKPGARTTEYARTESSTRTDGARAEGARTEGPAESAEGVAPGVPEREPPVMPGDGASPGPVGREAI